MASPLAIPVFNGRERVKARARPSRDNVIEPIDSVANWSSILYGLGGGSFARNVAFGITMASDNSIRNISVGIAKILIIMSKIWSNEDMSRDAHNSTLESWLLKGAPP